MKVTVAQLVEFFERARTAVLPESGHWTDKHIILAPTGLFIAYDEAGQEHGVYDTQEDARDALVEYERTLSAVPGHTEECEIDGVHYVVMAGNRGECLASLITEE